MQPHVRLHAFRRIPFLALVIGVPALSHGAGAALDSTLPPGGNFDLSIWNLQMPTGSGNSVTTIKAKQLAGDSGYSDSNYFYTDTTDGAMTFMDPQTGITTSGSLHCRTELRETQEWPATGGNVLTVTGEVAQLGGGAGGHVTVGQIFDYNTSKPLCEIEYYAAGNFQLLLENTNAGGDANFYPLGAGSVGTRYTYSLSLTDTTLTVTVNGMANAFTPDKSFNGAQFYFKCGDYDQTATAGTISTTPYTVVKVYSLNVQHPINSSIAFWRDVRDPSAGSTLSLGGANNPGKAWFDLRGRTVTNFAHVSVLLSRARSK